MAAAVGADADDLHDVAGPLGVAQGDAVRVGVARGGPRRSAASIARVVWTVASAASSPAAVADARRAGSRNAAAALDVAAHPAHRRPATPAPATPRPGRCRRAGPPRTSPRPRRGGRGGTGARPACGPGAATAGSPSAAALGVRRRAASSHVAAQVLQVAAQLGEPGVVAGRPRRGARASSSASRPSSVGARRPPARPRGASAGSPSRSAQSRAPARRRRARTATSTAARGRARRGGAGRARRTNSPPSERGPVAVRASPGRGSRNMPASPDQREQRGRGRRGRATSSSVGRRRTARGRRGRAARARRSVDAGEDLLGEVVEQHGVAVRAAGRRASSWSSGPPRRTASAASCTASGQPPVAADDLGDARAAAVVERRARRRRRRRWRGRCAVIRATSPAARSRAMRSGGGRRQASTRCSRGGRCSTSASRNSRSGSPLRDVGVVDDDERVRRRSPAAAAAQTAAARAAVWSGWSAESGARRGRQQVGVERRGRRHEPVDELARQGERGPAGRRAGDLDGRCRAREPPQHRRLAPAGGRDHERQAVGERDVYPRRRPGIDIPGGGHQPQRTPTSTPITCDAGTRRFVTIALQRDRGARPDGPPAPSAGSIGDFSGGHPDSLPRRRSVVPARLR